MMKSKTVLKVNRYEDGSMDTEICNFAADEMPAIWNAVTCAFIGFTEKYGEFNPDMETAMHGMLDCVIKSYKMEKGEKKPSKSIKNIPLESFEAFKEDFFKEMPEAREKFEGGNQLSQAISDAILKGTYEMLKERSKK